MRYIFHLIFFGFLFTAVLGLLSSWIDRKVTARVQYRVGPPFWQPLVDIVKLLGKETLVPDGACRAVFLLAPLTGLAGVILVATLLWMNNIYLTTPVMGDVLVVLYLFILPSISIMIGGFASANPLAALGASREMKLILSYELPFALSVLVPVIKSDFSLKLGEIIGCQMQNGVFAASLSGFLALCCAILCMQAKLALVPFDIPEAETEIVSGPLVEYSGAALAVYKLMKNMLLFVLPFFLIILFMGGLHLRGLSLLAGILKYVLLLVLIVVIRNTNPRLRIDQAVRFFWGPVTALAAVAVILALLGM